MSHTTSSSSHLVTFTFIYITYIRSVNGYMQTLAHPSFFCNLLMRIRICLFIYLSWKSSISRKTSVDLDVQWTGLCPTSDMLKVVLSPTPTLCCSLLIFSLCVSSVCVASTFRSGCATSVSLRFWRSNQVKMGLKWQITSDGAASGERRRTPGKLPFSALK